MLGGSTQPLNWCVCVFLKCWTCLATFKQHPGGVVLEMCVDDPEKDDNMQAAEMADVGPPQSLFLCVPFLLIACWGLDRGRTCQHIGKREGRSSEAQGHQEMEPRDVCLLSGCMTHWIRGCQTVAPGPNPAHQGFVCLGF